MSIIDTYLSEARSALATGDPREVDRIAREIVSAFHSEIPHLSSYRGARIIGDGRDMHSPDDLRKLVGKLRVLREEKDRELYGPYGLDTISEHIRLLEDAMDTGIEGDELKALYERVDHVYANYYKSYVSGLCGWKYQDDDPCDEQTELRIEKLKHFRDDELRKIRIAEAQGANLSVSATSESSSTSSASIQMFVAIEQIDNLPDSSLAEDEKTVLKGMMADLQTKDAGKREGKLQKILGWLANKGTDVFIAAMPYIVQAVQSQM